MTEPGRPTKANDRASLLAKFQMMTIPLNQSRWMLRATAWLSAFVVVVAATGSWVLRDHHGSLGFRCGLLPAANDSFLDGSQRLFQRCSWHLGNGTCTWGETYGVKIGRVYLSAYVRHHNPRVTEERAREND